MLAISYGQAVALDQVAAEEDLMLHCADIPEDQLIAPAGLQLQGSALVLAFDLERHFIHEDMNCDRVLIMVIVCHGAGKWKNQKQGKQDFRKSHGFSLVVPEYRYSINVTLIPLLSIQLFHNLIAKQAA